MIKEKRTIYFFEKSDKVAFDKWKVDNHLSLRKIGKQLGVSHTIIDDMLRGRRSLNEQFLSFLYSHELVIVREDKLYIRGATLWEN